MDKNSINCTTYAGFCSIRVGLNTAMERSNRLKIDILYGTKQRSLLRPLLLFYVNTWVKHGIILCIIQWLAWTNHPHGTLDNVFNFSAGPAALPKPVMKRKHKSGLHWLDSLSTSALWKSAIAAKSLFKLPGRGVCEQDLRDLLNIPDNYKDSFLSGGARAQFAAVLHSKPSWWRDSLTLHWCGLLGWCIDWSK